jgi:hypothetical protein
MAALSSICMVSIYIFKSMIHQHVEVSDLTKRNAFPCFPVRSS